MKLFNIKQIIKNKSIFFKNNFFTYYCYNKKNYNNLQTFLYFLKLENNISFLKKKKKVNRKFNIFSTLNKNTSFLNIIKYTNSLNIFFKQNFYLWKKLFFFIIKKKRLKAKKWFFTRLNFLKVISFFLKQSIKINKDIIKKYKNNFFFKHFSNKAFAILYKKKKNNNCNFFTIKNKCYKLISLIFKKKLLNTCLTFKRKKYKRKFLVKKAVTKKKTTVFNIYHKNKKVINSYLKCSKFYQLIMFDFFDNNNDFNPKQYKINRFYSITSAIDFTDNCFNQYKPSIKKIIPLFLFNKFNFKFINLIKKTITLTIKKKKIYSLAFLTNNCFFFLRNKHLLFYSRFFLDFTFFRKLSKKKKFNRNALISLMFISRLIKKKF